MPSPAAYVSEIAYSCIIFTVFYANIHRIRKLLHKYTEYLQLKMHKYTVSVTNYVLQHIMMVISEA